ncbi:MAG: putative quinol monooxygenase [Actinomycetota bacterium]
MIALFVRYRVKAGKMEAVIEALGEMAPLARSEEGCREYLVQRSKDDADGLALYEIYDDDEALAVHAGTEYFKRIISDRVVPMLKSREREYYELLDV